MKKIKDAFKSKESILQFIKFGIVGFSNTVLGFGVYYFFLWIGVNYLISNAISWIISVFNAFYWNNKYVFSNENSWVEALIRTYISYGVSLFVSTALLFFLVKWCNMSEIMAPIICLLITIPLNFLLNKFWTFK